MNPVFLAHRNLKGAYSLVSLQLHYLRIGGKQFGKGMENKLLKSFLQT